LLINISATEDSFAMSEFMEASALIQEKVDDDAKVVIGALYDESLGDELHVTVIATGVGSAAESSKTIAQVEDLPSSRKQQEAVKVQLAQKNPRPAGTMLPNSNFDGLDNSGGSGDTAGQHDSWNDEYLETPTYLRKKAN
nr:cell division protein FtsZ [Desulfocapsaceae bacterium]